MVTSEIKGIPSEIMIQTLQQSLRDESATTDRIYKLLEHQKEVRSKLSTALYELLKRSEDFGSYAKSTLETNTPEFMAEYWQLFDKFEKAWDEAKIVSDNFIGRIEDEIYEIEMEGKDLDGQTNIGGVLE